MKLAVSCEKIHKVFYEIGFLSRRKKKKVVGLEGVSFSVAQREIFGIVGPNGSGKSTLVRILSTLLSPDEGIASIFDYDVVRHPHEVRRLINRVSVDAAFFKKLSAWENLRYAARLYGLSIKDAKKESLNILAELDFGETRFYEPLEDLSRGMQQKVAIARAFFTSPVLLLLDEPTTGLDPRSKRSVQDYILEMHRTRDLTVLLTTHDMEEADRLCDRVAIIDQGKFVAVDKPEMLKNRIARDNHKASVTLEDVFFALTHKEWEE
jgi:ABC-2 type transport system ATP-binding protein